MNKPFLDSWMKVFLLSLIVFVLSADMLSAQITTPRNNRNTNSNSAWGNSNDDLQGRGSEAGRWFLGGNLGASIGTSTYIDVSPLAGYRFTEKFSVGAGLIFNYINRSFVIGGPSTSQTLYGLRALTRYQIFNDLFLQAEISGVRYSINGLEGDFITRFPVGGGYRMRAGGNSFFTIEALYDVLYDENDNIYPSPWIVRAGGTIGF